MGDPWWYIFPFAETIHRSYESTALGFEAAFEQNKFRRNDLMHEQLDQLTLAGVSAGVDVAATLAGEGLLRAGQRVLGTVERAAAQEAASTATREAEMVAARVERGAAQEVESAATRAEMVAARGARYPTLASMGRTVEVAGMAPITFAVETGARAAIRTATVGWSEDPEARAAIMTRLAAAAAVFNASEHPVPSGKSDRQEPQLQVGDNEIEDEMYKEMYNEMFYETEMSNYNAFGKAHYVASSEENWVIPIAGLAIIVLVSNYIS